MLKIGKYPVEKELGRGGFGRVYLAYDPDVDQRVAIKKLIAEGDPDLLKRFQLEIRTTAALRHKNIVSIYASGEDAGDPYLVMEFLEGRTLKDVIKERRPLSLAEKVRIMMQVAEGLGYANSKGVVHRDVKPENIMLLPDDNVKIMDFGIALAADRNTNVTQTGGIIGTPPYFAPEQLQGYKASEQTDIFSFGDVYYELLTGVHPFEQYKNDWKSLQIAIMRYEPRSISELVPGCPEAIETLVQRTLAKEPDFRYRTFEEIQLDSEAILVDLRHEEAATIIREVVSLLDSGNLHDSSTKVNLAYQLDPGNREVRRLREVIHQRIQREQAQTRIVQALADAEKLMAERRYAEAVETLEFAARLDPANVVVAERLEKAKARLDGNIRATRLVEEARFRHQKGLLFEAEDRLQEALRFDPEHTEAIRLRDRVFKERERRRLEEQRQQAIGSAQEHRAARRFGEALAVLDAIEKEFPGDPGIAEIRVEVLKEREEEALRLRAERLNLGLLRTRETMQAGNLELARQMLDHLDANYGSDPSAASTFAELRVQLEALARAREVSQYQQRARAHLKAKEFREALGLLTEALGKFSGDAGLERLLKTAEEGYRAHRRAVAIAVVLQDATAKRDAGDLQGALDTISKGRRDLGEEAALLDLARQLEIELEQQRYSAALEALLQDTRKLLAAGGYSQAIDRLMKATEFSGEAEVQALLSSARVARDAAEEGRFVEHVLSAAGKLQSEEAWTRSLEVVESGLARYPHNSGLVQAAGELRNRVKLEQRRSAIARQQSKIGFEIQQRSWKGAEAALREARAKFPGEPAFDDLARQIEAGLYEDGWRQLQARVHQHLAANSVSHAEDDLRNQQTQTVYGRDSRWLGLEQEVARWRRYEDALAEADRQRNAGNLSEADKMLTDVIDSGAPDKRADQKRAAIRVQHSESLRQQEIARIAEGIGELLNQGDVAQAAANLAAGRSRYPGESVWNDLQTNLDARQQVYRRAIDLAAAEQGVRQALARDDPRHAAAALNAARARYPGEAVWEALGVEIQARQAVAQRSAEIAAAGQAVRRRLSREPRGDPPEGGSFTSRYQALLHLRREDLQEAVAELDAARAKYPGDPLWDALQAEADSRRAFLDAEALAAERIAGCMEREEAAQALSQLTAARAQYPDEGLWRLFAAETGRLEGQFQARAEMARLTGRVREHVRSDDPEGAYKELDAARARYPQEGAWSGLRQEIDALRAQIQERQTEAARVAEIAAVAVGIRERLGSGIQSVLVADAELPIGVYPLPAVWDVLMDATTRLEQARDQHQGEAIWEALAAEIAERQKQLERAITETIRTCASLDWLNWNASQLAAARARHPDEFFWAVLQREIDARREPLERASIAVFEGLVRECLKQGDARTALVRLDTARKVHPGAKGWDQLQAEIDLQQARSKRQTDLDAAERAVREQLALIPKTATTHESVDSLGQQCEAFRWAGALLDEAQAKYPDEKRLPALRAETGRVKERWRQQQAQLISGALQAQPQQGVVPRLRPIIHTLRTNDPDEPRWARLEAEIEVLEARLNRQAEVAAIGKGVRTALEADNLQDARHQLEAALARYRDDPLWPTLQAEIQARHAEIQEIHRQAEAMLAQGRPQDALDLTAGRFASDPSFADLLGRAHQALAEEKRREARNRARDQMLGLEQQFESEARHRKRRDLDRQSQALAATYSEDPEIAAIAARIHARAEALDAEAAATRRPVPWTLIGGGLGALAAVGLLVAVLHHPEPRPKPVTAATIPVEIRSDPAGAAITVESHTCITPNCRLDLAPGSHQVQAQLQGFEPKRETLVVDTANHSLELKLTPVAPTPPPNPGALVVQAELEGALVYVDGVPQPERTDRGGSVTLALAPKLHQVWAEKSGYRKSPVQQIGVTSGARQILSVRLIPLDAHLEMVGAAGDFELWVDGKSLGRPAGTPYLFPQPLKPGERRVSVRSGLIQIGQAAPSRELTAMFDPGSTVQFRWKPDQPQPTLPTTPPSSPAPAPTGGTTSVSIPPPVAPPTGTTAPTPSPGTIPPKPPSPTPEETEEEQSWRKLQNNRDYGQLMDFQKQHPSSRHASELNELIWKAVDQSKLDQVRRFDEQNPSNPHKAEARQILESASQVIDVVKSLDAALQRDQRAKIKLIWPLAPPAFLNPGTHTTRELSHIADPVIAGDRAKVTCTITTHMTQNRQVFPQAATIELRRQNGQWLIENFTLN